MAGTEPLPPPPPADPPAQPAAPEPPPPPQWRQTEARARHDRRHLRALAVLALVIVGGTLALLATWYQPLGRPTLIVLAGPTAGSNALPQGLGDRAALRQLAGFDHLGTATDTPADAVALIRRAPSAGPLVVALSARAWLGWPDRPDPPASGPGAAPRPIHLGTPNGPRLSEVVAALRDRSTAGQLFLLDLSGPPDDPRSGDPDPAAVLAEVHRWAESWVAEPHPDEALRGPRAVLLAAAPGQQTAESAALGRSVFSLYVEQGLRGGADHNSDGRITARELAAFSRDRVARHVRRVRNREQTPLLVQSERDEDFALIATPRQAGPAPALPAEAPTYPTWLAEGWRGRDALLASGAGHEAPRPLAQLEAALLRAEQGWRGRADADQVRIALRDALEPLRERIALTRVIPRPPARSLAQARANGSPPSEDATRQAVAQALAQRPVSKPDSKPGEVEAAEVQVLTQFFALVPATTPGQPPQARFRSPLDLAEAVVAVAASDPAPTPGAFRFLDRLLAQPRPLFGETAALRALADPAAIWSPEPARRALTLALDAERLQAEPIGLLGDPAGVAEAARLIHEAQVIFAAPGYAKAGEVDRRQAAAREAADDALLHLATLQAARNLSDDATRLLPEAVALLSEAPELERPWLDAADAATAILDQLGRLELAPDETNPASTRPINLGDLADRVAALRRALAAFEPAGLATRVALASRAEPPPGPAQLRAADALLASSLPTAEGRVALSNSAIAAERSAVASVLRLDAADGSTVPPGASDEARTSPPAATSAEDSPDALRRQRVVGRLLALGGLAVPGQSALGTTQGPPSLLGPGQAGASGAGTPAARDRLARLLPPGLAVPGLDTADLDPTRHRRIDEFRALRRHLAARYAFEARDAGGSAFASDAVTDFEALGDPPTPLLTVDADPLGGTLDANHPEAALVLVLRPVGPAPIGPVQAEVQAGGRGWLALMAQAQSTAGAVDLMADEPVDPWPTPLPPEVRTTPVRVPIRVRLRDGAEPPPGPIPPGLLVRARFGSRTAHRFVPLTVEPASYRLRVALTADPAGTGPDLPEARLRPAQGKTPFYLHVRNPGVRERRVIAELLDQQGSIPRALAPLTVPAGGSTRLAFGPPSAKPDEGFGLVRGPLIVRLTDPTGAMAPVERTIPVGLADPTRIVRVVESRFEPAAIREGGRSRLTLRLQAVGPIVGPPCPVELSLDPERIPGLLTPGEGTYAGKLAKVGDEATLSVEGIEVDRRLGGTGLLDLAIDGLPRAVVLRAALGQRTTATVPAWVTEPALALRLDPATRPGTPVRVGIDADSPPEAGRLVVEIGQPTADGGFNVESRREADSIRGRFLLNPTGPEGALIGEATVAPLAVTLEPGTIRGRRLVQARLLDETGRLVATAETPLVFDDRSPTGVEFVRPAKYGLKGGTVRLAARAATVPDAGWREVAFFVGELVDGKRPPGAKAIAGRPIGRDGLSYSAVIPLADAKLGPTPITVEFVTGVGLSRSATTTVAVVEVIPPEPSLIRGQVLLQQLPQPNLPVVVRDDKGAQKAQAKTNDAGQFEVAGLPPGSYRLTSNQATPPLSGFTDVTLTGGETLSVKISLYRPVR